MERKRRRWWTWGLSTAAALVVLAATLSLTFRLVMDAVPGYRDKLQNMVAQAAGHPTRIGAMGHSLGGIVAMVYAIRHPEQPSKLVLSSTSTQPVGERSFAVFDRLGGPRARAAAMDAAAAARFAGLALKCLHAEYPNHLSHTLDSDADARPPRVLNPAFYGCYDWHSDVHGHWLLVRLVRLFPDAPFAQMARAELALSLNAQNIAGEVAYLQRTDRASFERPYGLAWLLQLSAELRIWKDPQAQQWATVLRPLETNAKSTYRGVRERPFESARHPRQVLIIGSSILKRASIAGTSQNSSMSFERFSI